MNDEFLELFEFWVELTGYDGKLMIIDIADITNQSQRRREGLAVHGWDMPAQQADELLDPERPSGTVALWYTFSGEVEAREDTEHSFIILNRPETAKSQRFLFELLAHEFGHAIDHRMLTIADDETKEAVREGYENWRKEVEKRANEGMTVREFYNEFMNVGAPRVMAMWRRAGFKRGGELDLPISALNQQFFWDYVAGRNEWMADQAARWLNTQPKALTVLERFWDTLAQALKRFYGWITKHEDIIQWDTETPGETEAGIGEMSKAVSRKRALNRRRDRWFPDKSIQDWLDELAAPFDVRLLDLKGVEGETPAQRRRREFEEFYKKIRERQMDAQKRRDLVRKKRAQDREAAYKKKRVSDDRDGNKYQTPYTPMSENGGEPMLTPTNAAEATRLALVNVVEKHARPILESEGIVVEGDKTGKMSDGQILDRWVRHELGYDTTGRNNLFGTFEDDQAAIDTFEEAFNGHQVDAIALAIAAHRDGGALVLGDQTGAGKGRVVAAFMLYAKMQGQTPVFMTDKVNLFNDMYSDLKDIGVVDPNIFSFNNEVIVDRADETIVRQAPLPEGTHKKVISDLAKSANAVKNFDFVFTTYSQIMNAGSAAGKQRALRKLAHSGTLIALDESHLVSGTGALGRYMQGVIQKPVPENGNNGPAGVLYASATWAKRPDNLMIYARTDMPIATAGNLQDLQRVLHDAGDNMVEVVTGMLAEAGQYLRRERDLDGRSIPPEGEPDSTGEAKAEMGRKADRLNEVLRTMVAFDDAHMYPIKKSFDALVKAVARKKRKSPRMKIKANVAAGRLSSQRFQALNNMLLALKAEGLAKEVIRAWKEDNVKPVIASYHTLTAFTEWYIEEEGLADGDVAENFSYLRTIERVLARSRRVVITDQQGNVTELPNILQPGVFEAWVEKNVPVEEKRDPDNPGPNDKPNLIKEQPFEGDIEFIKRLIERARTEYAATSTTVSTDGKMLEDLPGAPVDYVLTKLRAAGMKVAEITGRAKKAHFEVDYTDPSKPVVRRVDAMSKVEAIAGFNRDDFDAAFLNNAAATGMSMHQKPVAGVHDENNMPKQRWMFILQAAPDISAFMQIIGRVDRLGQVGPAKVRPTDDDEEWGQNNDGIPLYSQWVTPLLTEMRPIQMHMRKLKTLNAGTTASGKSAFDVEEVQNIENEYGDVVVTTYLRVNSDIAAYIRPRLNKRQKEQLADRAQSRVPGISSILTKEMMYLPVEVQARAYSEIDAEYVEHINFLNAIGANELETGVRDLEAETIATDEIAPAMAGTTSPFGRAAIVETVMANKKELPWLVSRITQAMNAEMDKYGIDYSVKQDPQWETWDTEVFNDPTDPVSGTAAARRSLVGNAVEALDLNNRILRIHNEMLATLEEGEKGNEQVLAELKENKWFYRKALRGRPFEREWTKSIVQALRDGQGVTLAQYFTNPPPENNKAYREYMDHFVEVARTNNQEYAEHMRAVQALPMEDRPETDLDDEKIRTRIERATAVTNALRTIFEATEFSDTRHAQLPVLGAVYEMNLDAITQQDQGVQNTRGVFIGLEYKKDSTRTPEQPPVLSEWSARFAITPSAEQAVVSIKLNSLSQNVNIASWMSYATLGSVREYFESEEAQNAREERYLVTGNLIAGYQAIRAMFNRGRPIVAYFTRKGGEDEQGIIPPKAFDPGNIIVAGPPASGTEDVMKRIEDGQIIRAGDYSLQARMMSKNSYYYKEDDEEVIVRVDARTQASKKRPGGAGARWHLEGKRDGYAKDIKKILQEHYPSTGVKQKSRVADDFWFPQDQDGREARRAYKEHYNDKGGKHKFNYYLEIRISKLAFQDIIAYAYSKGEGFRQMSDSEKEVGSAFYLLPNPNEDPPAFFNFKTEEMSESIERPFWKKKKGPKRGNPKAEDVISDETVHGYVFDKKGRTQQRKEWLERMLKKADNGIWHMASVFGYEAQTMRTKGKRGRPRKYWPDRIRRFYAHTGAAFTEAAVMMEDVLSGLQGHDEYVKWKVYVEMRDLLERAKHHGNHVPMDMTVEAMEQTLEEVVRSMSPQQRRRVTRAVQNYWNMWNKIGEDLAARGKLSKKGQHKTYMPHIVLDYLRAEFSEALPATLRSPFRGYTVKANGSVRPTEDVLEASIRRIGQIKRHNAMDDLIDEFVADFGIKYKRGDTPREGYEFVELHRKRGAYPVMTVTDRGIELATKVGIEAGVEDDLAEQFGRGTPEYEEAMKELKTGMGIATAWLRNNIRSGYWLPTHLAHRVAHWRGDINRGQPFMTMVNKATQMWKAITIVKASLTSAHQVMNFVGDMINVTREDIFAPTEVFRIGVRDPDGNRVTGAIPTLMRAARGKYDQYWREALHEGVITSNWAHEELPDIVNVTRQKRGRLRDLEGTREYNPFRWLTKTYLDLSNFRENIARMALYIRRRKAGDSVEVAAKKAREAPVDYGRQTESERRFFSGMLFPFWTWQANNTINWFKYAKDHPVKFAAKSPLFFGGQAARFIGKRLDPTILQNYVVWYPLIQMLSAAAAWNDHDEERREAEAMLPEWIKDRWHITLGLSSSGTPLALMLSLPQDELLENFGGAALLGARSYKEAQWALWGGVVQTLGELATPWLRVPGEIYANKKVFSGAAVTPRYMKSQGGKVSRRDVDRRFGLGLSPEQAYALDALFTPSKAIGQDLEEGGVLESLWGAEDPDLPHAHKMLGIRAKASYGKEPSTHRNLMRAADDVERLMATGVTRSAAIRGMNLPEGVTARALLGEVRSRERAEETSAMTLQERSDYFGGKAEKRDMTEARSSAAFYLAQEILLKEQGNRREARAMRNRAMEIIEGVGGYRKFYEGSKHKKAAFQRSIRDHYRQAVEEEK